MPREIIDYRNHCPALLKADRGLLKPDIAYQIDINPMRLDEARAVCPIGSEFLERKTERNKLPQSIREKIKLDNFADELAGLDTNPGLGGLPSNLFEVPTMVEVYRSTINLTDEEQAAGEEGDLCLSCDGCPLVPYGFESYIVPQNQKNK